MDAFFFLLPTIVFLYTIFNLICYCMLADYEKTGSKDGKPIFDVKENPSISYNTEQKLYANGKAKESGFIIDEFLPIFLIVLIDWLCNFLSMIIYMASCFLYNYGRTGTDRMEENKSEVQIYTFMFNMTLQNLVIMTWIKSSDQLMYYSLQDLELRIDLTLLSTFSLFAIILYLIYVIKGKIFDYP